MKKKRKKQQVDNRAVIITLVSAIISLINSTIALIITLSH
ncbi:cytochrome c oxidase assembly protein Cox11 [Paenibacillus harenae]|uniref:Cytochrome c oxidase assembly protein Cox11 n=1 Tax=Paenibacillus harenae TaxID=306543 RepID=A0ABT9U415_PAEHA|nr:cytochrome c oxidase assembly protein Cox11 [Paenibacillus harenae]